MISQHVMSGILESWVESKMLTYVPSVDERYSVLMLKGNLKAPLYKPYKDFGDRSLP